MKLMALITQESKGAEGSHDRQISQADACSAGRSGAPVFPAYLSAKKK